MDVFRYALLGLLTTPAVAQRLVFSDLPPAPYYPDGEFLVPKPVSKDGTVINQIYVQGALMNVTWKTKYPSINLWVGGDDPDAGRTQLLTGYTGNSYLWTVNDYGNNTWPFILHFTNAEGSEDDQLHGGVWAGYFWIADLPLVAKYSSSAASVASAQAALTASTTSSKAPSTLTTSATSTSSTTMSSTSTSGSSSSSPASPGVTSSLATSSSIITTTNSSTTSTASPKTTSESVVANATTPTSADDSKSSSTNNVVLAAGIGIGCAVFLIIVAGAAMLYFWRRQRKPSSEKQAADIFALHGHVAELPPDPPRYVRNPLFEAPTDRSYAEAPGNMYDEAKEAPFGNFRVEAPGCYRRPAQELPGSEWQRPNAAARKSASMIARGESWWSKPHPPTPSS